MVGRFPMCALFLGGARPAGGRERAPKQAGGALPERARRGARPCSALVREAHARVRRWAGGSPPRTRKAPRPHEEPKADFALVRLDNPLDGQVTPPAQAERPAKRRGTRGRSRAGATAPGADRSAETGAGALEPAVIPAAPARSALEPKRNPGGALPAPCPGRGAPPARGTCSTLIGHGPRRPGTARIRPDFRPALRRVRPGAPEKPATGGNGPGCASRETCRVCAGKLPGNPVRPSRPRLKRSSKPLRRKIRHRARRFGWWASCSIPTGSLKRATGCSLWTSTPRMSACSTTG